MPILIMIFFALIGTTVFGQCGGNTSFVINPSFEGPLAPHVTPTSWDICMPGYTPDTQPGSWDISLAPTNGGSYLGLVHCGYWQEGAGQTISSPMLANETYHFTIDLATTSSTGGGINPGCVELQVWGGWSGLNGGCDQSQLLWSSGDVWDYQHINNWVTHDIVFTPNANYDHILFLINGLGCSACPYIMIDNMSPIVPATNFCDFSHTEVCLGSPTQFTDLSSSANSTIASWLWNFGGGVTSTQQNPSYTFPTSGYHSVTLTIVTNEPCTLTVTKNIFVKEAPNATASIFSYPTCGQNNGSVVANGGVSYVWNTNPPQYSNYATTIPAGNYTVTVTGVNNCTAIANVALTQTQGLTYTSNVQQPTCSQPLSGAITLSITSGNPPFTYSWDMGSTSNMLTDLCVGSYTCTLSDNAGCSSVFSTMILPPQAVNTSIAAYTNCTCYNTDNGTASVSVTGGTAPFYYLWSSGSLPLNTQNINGLPSGNHSVTVSDANGCSSVSTVTITKPDTIKATFQVTDALCGFSNGSILANVTGGTPGYSFTWYSSPAQTGNPAQNLSSGNYNVQVRDANNCISNFTTTVNSTGVVNLSAAQTQHVSCYGYNDGSANITFNGGTFPYTINCSSGFNQTTSLLNTNISNLSSGNYTITVSDANNCQSSSSFTINQPQPISIIGITQNDHCNQLIGAINISASGGSGNYNYLWNYNGLISEDIFNIPSGIYSVTATDNNTCTGSAVFNILNIEGPSASLSGTDILCYGGNDGSIYATVSEGTSPLTFLWNTGNDQSSINNLTAGTYSISITDSAGCSTFESLTINQPTQVSLSVSSITNASGYGASDGSAIVAGQGGTPPYQFNWSNNQTGTTVTNLAAGTYIVTLTDQNGCFVSDTIQINQPDPLIANIDIFYAVTCHSLCNGITSIAVSGGVPPYSYNWPSGNTQFVDSTLCIGQYVVTVTDFYGYMAFVTVTMTEPDTISYTTLIIDDNCDQSHGAVDLTATGGTGNLSYLWNDGTTDQDRNQIPQGNYFVTITDENNCQVIVSCNVNNIPGPVASIPPPLNVSCYGYNNGNCNVIVTGGSGNFMYLWNTSLVDTLNAIDNLSAGEYEVTVTDIATQCFSIASTTITQPEQLNFNFTFQNTSCFDSCNGTITITPFGGTNPISILWNDNNNINFTRTNLCASIYLFTLLDNNGCVLTDSVAISKPEQLSASLTASEISCHGICDGTITANVTGGTAPYSYLWNNNCTNNVITNVCAGNYSLAVSDNNGCLFSTTYNLSQPELLIFDSVILQNPKCYNDFTGSISINASGGTNPLSFAMNNQTVSSYINMLPEGLYEISITDFNNCIIDTIVELTYPLPLLINLPSDIHLCYGEDSLITAIPQGGTPPYNCNWSNGISGNSQIVNTNDTLTLYFVCTDINGCVQNAATTLFPGTPVVLNAIASADSICPGINITIIANISGGSGAPYTTYVNNIVTPLPSNFIPTQTNNIYIVKATDICGSSDSDTIKVNFYPEPELNFTATPRSGCAPLHVTLSVNQPENGTIYQWLPELNETATGINADFIFSQPGVYNVTLNATNIYGCSSTKLVTDYITVYFNPDASFMPDPAVTDIMHSEVQFYNHSNGGNNYEWHFGDGYNSGVFEPYHTFRDTGTFQIMLIVTNQNNCKDTAIRTVKINDVYSLYAPTAFSPDFDGLNEIFSLKGTGILDEGFLLVIYDRWGEPIFNANNISQGWNGYIGNTWATTGTYVWHVKCKTDNGKLVEKSGNFTLIR